MKEVVEICVISKCKTSLLETPQNLLVHELARKAKLDGLNSFLPLQFSSVRLVS